jgi:four helix bundle protein
MAFDKTEHSEVRKKAQDFWVAVDAILQRQAFSREHKPRDQIKTAIDSITANMSEAFEQPTDKAFANFLFTSKGSTADACTRLGQSRARRCISDDELAAFKKQGEEIAKCLVVSSSIC